MSDFIAQLAKIRERQGKEPMPDPRVIQGFGENDPPPPDFVAQRLAEARDYEDGIEDEPEALPNRTPVPAYSAPEVSPLIPVQPVVPRSLADVELMVVNENATFRGRSCVLTEREKAALVTVILQAIKRSIKDQLREVQSMKPRRQRKATIVRQRKSK